MTDYSFITTSPMNELGDDLNQPAPVRKLRIVNFDGDKWCEIELEDGTKCNLKYWNISKPLSYTDVLCSLEDYK
jgi:hypothetical protein